MPTQVWNMFDGLPGIPARVPLSTPLLSTQQHGGWGEMRRDIVRGFSPVMMAGLGDGEFSTPGEYGAGAASTIIGRGASGEAVALAAPQIAGAALGTAAMLQGPFGWAAAAIPIAGPIIIGVTIGLTLLFGRKGPKQKVATTQIVDQVEPLLRENVDGYLSGSRTQLAYEQALANFQAGWAYVVEHCDTPVMGEPGQRCVQERQEGATPPWGGRNWFQMYRDPILANPPQQDPQVITDPISSFFESINGPEGGKSTGAGGIGMNTGVLAIGGLLLVALLMGDK